MTMTAHSEGASQMAIAELLTKLRDEATRLLREEVALAKQEVSEKTSTVARNSGYLVAGGLIAYGGILVIMLGIAAVVYTLLAQAGVNQLAAGCLALLLVGGTVAGIGVALVMRALSTLKASGLMPERTMETLHDNNEWIREKVGR